MDSNDYKEIREDPTANVLNKKCQQDGCCKIPAFNFKGEKEMFFCFTHKKEGMINIANKRCHQDECDKHPSYNFEGKRPGIFVLHI